jgi:FkbM family methyltransferase
MGASLVIAIEPDPLNAEAFRRNLAEPIRDGRVKLIEKALWDTEGTLTLHRADTSAETTAAIESIHGEELIVPMTTLDRLIEELKLDRVDFIKMDIEGAEQAALRGAVETLKRHRPILAIGSYHKADDLDEIPRIVLNAVPQYTITSSRCLMAEGQVIPHLLYFHVPGN